MPENVRRGNATKSEVRTLVEHVFAQHKAKMGLFVCFARGEAKITLTNLVT